MIKVQRAQIRALVAVNAALAAACLVVSALGVTVAVARRSAPAAAANRPSVLVSREAPAPAPAPAVPTIVVPRLHRVRVPDVLVRLPRAATRHQLSALRHQEGVAAFTVADTGTMRLAGTRLQVWGVDVASVRGLTPRLTATSRPLWRSVLAGEVTVSYTEAGRLGRRLGQTLLAHPLGGARSAVPLRVGAFATVGLGDAQALVDRSRRRDLALRADRVVVVAAPRLARSDLAPVMRDIFGAAAWIRVLRPPSVEQTAISAYARSVIPAGYLALYRAAAATCRGLPWTVLAAIGTVETGNGRNTATSSKGAMGPMQFMPSTFAAYAVDGDGDGVADIQDPADAVYSAARYLCFNGAGLGGQSLYAAIFAYNHADWYVREVVRLALAYS